MPSNQNSIRSLASLPIPPLFEAGKIFLDHAASWRIDLEQELLSFPKSAHDDQVDSLSQALTYLQQRKNLQVRSL